MKQRIPIGRADLLENPSPEKAFIVGAVLWVTRAVSLVSYRAEVDLHVTLSFELMKLPGQLNIQRFTGRVSATSGIPL